MPTGIKTFSGLGQGSPRVWLRRFNALAKALGWDDEQKLEKFQFYLTGPASDWYYEFVEFPGNAPEDFP